MTKIKLLLPAVIAGAIGGAIIVSIVFLFSPTLNPKNPIPSSTTKNQTLALSTQEKLVTDVVEQANPAVISIVITKDVPIIERYSNGNNLFNDLFGDNGSYFNPFQFKIPPQRQRGTKKQEVGGGSGFIVSADGYAVTNRHVVENTEASYTAFTSNGKKHNVEVIAKDPILDIAIIKLKDRDSYSFLTLGDSSKIKVGQSAIAIGNALGEFKNTVSVGVVSGLYRSITATDNLGEPEELDQVIQTDTAINPGNSGGPLLNLNGQVIGVNVAIVSDSQNIGFALPVNTIKPVIESVKLHGKIIRPYLGLRYIKITSAFKDKNKLPVDTGVLVARGETADDLAVIPGSPADKAGIVENDIILEVDGAKLDDKNSLALIIRSKSIGQVVNLKIIHRGEYKIVTLKLETAPE